VVDATSYRLQCLAGHASEGGWSNARPERLLTSKKTPLVDGKFRHLLKVGVCRHNAIYITIDK
jgi:hypothetical protein